MREQTRRRGVSKEADFASRPPVKKAFTLHMAFARASFFGSARRQMKLKKNLKNARHITRYAFRPHTERYLRNSGVMFFIKSSTALTTNGQEKREREHRPVSRRPNHIQYIHSHLHLQTIFSHKGCSDLVSTCILSEPITRYEQPQAALR